MNFRFFYIFIVCLICFGCGKPKAPDYDRFQAQLIQELFAHISTGNSSVAVRQLERLQTLYPEQTFFRAALPRERERLAVQTVNTLIQQGRFDEATGSLRAFPQGANAPDSIQNCRKTLQALLALKTYCSNLPFEKYSEANSSLNRLAPSCRILIQAPGFPQWYNQQQLTAVNLDKQENWQTLQQIALDCDLIAVSDPQRYPLMLSSLMAADTNSRFQPEFKQALGTLFKDIHQAGEPTGLTGVVIQDSIQAGLPAVWSGQTSKEPLSLSALLTQISETARAGRLVDALRQLQALQSQVSVSDMHVRRLVAAHILPWSQLLATPWQSPCPTITDYMNRVAQIREQAGARSRKKP